MYFDIQNQKEEPHGNRCLSSLLTLILLLNISYTTNFCKLSYNNNIFIIISFFSFMQQPLVL